MSLEDLMDDIGEERLSAEDVQRRVDDWLVRIDELLSGIRTWAHEAGWSVEAGTPVPMDEDPMRRAGLSPRQQPALRLRTAAGAELWIRPKALWVIGANGRVDLFSMKGAFILIDVAEPYQDASWVLHIIGKQHGRPFHPALLAELV